MLHYSNVSLFGNRADFPAIMVWNTDNVSSPVQFKESLRTIVDVLLLQAASGGSLMKVAAGNHTAPDSQTIYAMLQCTPDMSEEDCSGCLKSAAQHIPQCCDSKRAATILLPSCNLQYGLGPFYNITRIQEVQAAVSMTSPPPVPAPAPVPAPPADEGMSATESLQYDFGKIRAATDDFSDANKLGQGGFRVVYKGKLENGKEIAVKRLSRRSAQGEIQESCWWPNFSTDI
ncbi:UNVERIFIED_CONTAM: Cysteine-rich receptor-like protein kinase [Sesamum radiatum]|uniref:Cysteine-rich receptor-like protein kinase n=1 Tax=Sesamum radiatum TaxID=300843 RepID=A0AAW2TYG1_SESRA